MRSKKSNKGHHESKLEKLKNVVIRILKKQPDGVLKNDIWTLVHKETGLRVSAKDYGVSKMGRVFEKWTDVIQMNAEKLFLVSSQETLNENDFSPTELEGFGEEKESVTQSFCLSSISDIHTAQKENILYETDLKREQKRHDDNNRVQTGPDHDLTMLPDVFDTNHGRNKKTKDHFADFVKQNKNIVTFGFLSDSDLSDESDVDTDDERKEIKSVIDELIDGQNAEPPKSVNGQKAPSMPSWMHIAEASKPPEITKLETLQARMQLPVREQLGMPAVVTEEQRKLAIQTEPVMAHGQGHAQGIMSKPLKEPPGLSLSVNKEPAVQGLGSSQSEIPSHQFGVTTPGLGNMGFPLQGMVNRFYMPMQGHNQLGMFPTYGQTGMSLLGMPVTYRIPVPAHGHFGMGTSQNVVNHTTPMPQNMPIVGQPHKATELSGIPTTGTIPRESPSLISASESFMSATQGSPVNTKTWSHVVMSKSMSKSPSPISSPNVVLNSDNTEAGKPTPAWTKVDERESHLSHVQMPSPVPRMTLTPVSNFTGELSSKQENEGHHVGMSSAGISSLYNNIYKNQAVRPSARVSQMTMPMPLTVPGKNPPGAPTVPSTRVSQMTMPMPLTVPGRNPPGAPTVDWGQYNLPKQNMQVGYEGIIPQNYTALIENKKEQQTVISQFNRWDLDQWQPFADDIKDFAVKPIDKEEFEAKIIDVRPVYVPLGRKPSSEQVDSVAKECIEMLADANEFVTQERVEKLLLQRFGCNVIQELGVYNVDQVPCVFEHKRLVSKINTYITAFLKTRSICTLHELKEALRDYVPDKGDFSMLKTGPLQRFPVLFQQFRFPTNQAEIPEITSMDILEHFNNYLSKNRLWVNSKLELEPFMNYLVQEYDADNAYMLGVRIRSLPLAIGVLKKAKRDSAASHHEIKDHFEENLKTEIGDAFRKFRISILQTGEGDGLEVRRHYLKMKPELVIMEIFDKFNVLLMVTQDRRLTKPTKFRRVVEDFLTMLREDDLGKNILHLAICMSNTAVEETVREMFTPADDDSDEENENQMHHKPPPRKDALVASLKTYIERCLNAGAVSLTHLNRIEEKMLEEFGFPDFGMMGYGRFLEFLLLEETKQILEESVGLLLGSGSGGGDCESSFKPQQMDLVDFIKQCRHQEDSQPDHVEEALCAHYSVKNVRDLGYGNTMRLLSYAEKHGKHMQEQCSIFYESALAQSVRFSQNSTSKVGILGHQTRDAAKICLHNCPLLENMADWSQWSLVFEPELGKLKDFVQKYGGVTTKTYEGGKIVTLDFLALERKPGELVKIVSSTAVENVAMALKNRDVQCTAGHLVSMVVAYKGIDNMPLALIARHMKTALIQIHAEEPRLEMTAGLPSQNTAALFTLQCILRIPTKICVLLANQIFLEPLGQVVGSTKSKILLVQLCKTETELSHLIQLGCLLGIQEWTDVMQQKCQLHDSVVQILPSEVKEFFENDHCEVNQFPLFTSSEEEEGYIEVSDDSDTEDVDEILAGELSVDEVKETGESNKTVYEREAQDKEKKITIPSAETAKEKKDIEDDTRKEISSCEAVVNQIRRDEFGVGVQLSEDGQRLMKVQQERLGRSLDRLSKDLYSKDTHFVLELVQNADDNSYSDNLLNDTTDNCPSVKFVIEHEGIYVLNNEQGFREKDIRALCDVGRSTKGKHKFGYIGQKGIGFKSVFRITDAPEVHSNGYHIRFDVNSGPMGYILPHWVPEEERISQDEWMTHIILKLKANMRLQTRTLAARFNDIHPSLLLFLHRLRQITVENKVENSVQTMRRRDIGDNVVEIQHAHGSEKWLVVKKMLDASKISIQTKSGADVESTEIALAFPLNQKGKRTTVQRMPPKQPIFAFLPLRSYGFRFIIQGDFDVPSSREDVDRDSSWNQWLRNEIHNVFIECLDIFRTHPEFGSMEAVCAFLQFVPMEDEVLEFFKPVASDILKKLKAKQFVPTQANAEDISNSDIRKTFVCHNVIFHLFITNLVHNFKINYHL
ncbi:uncharacterized protein LOC128552593 [Mercenaria mercenaria]|uniref:uncharacterized protein LOC128552593 n=1 Tax=Mercenaria mercenaria TaxID=6596 RepID=UPI00234EF765|nr:uncharacterized protein LOC128552593 [Mercenaria mercenaria]